MKPGRGLAVLLALSLCLGKISSEGLAGVNKGAASAPGQGPKPVAPSAGHELLVPGKTPAGAPIEPKSPSTPESLAVSPTPATAQRPPVHTLALPVAAPLSQPLGQPAGGQFALPGPPAQGNDVHPEGAGNQAPGAGHAYDPAPGEESRAWLDRIFDGTGASPLGDPLAMPELEVDDPPALLEPALGQEEGEGSREERLARLRGKRLVVVSAGYSGKRFIFERARELGVEVVLIGEEKDLWARELVSEFVPVSSVVPEKAYAEAWGKLRELSTRSGPPEGLVTFWEDSVPLAGMLARQMGLPFHTVQGAVAARNKFASRKLMLQKNIPSPHFSLLTGADESLEAAMRWVGFPAVIKPLFGATALFVSRVNSPEETRETYARLSSEISPDSDSSFQHGTQLMLEQYIPGREFDLDLKMQRGKAVFASLTYNWPTRRRDFKSTGASLPGTAFSPEEEVLIEGQGTRLARAMGLVHGIIHLEGILGTDGVVYFIDPNGRMGGVYVRDWVKEVWGVDLVDEQLLLGADIPSTPAKPKKPLAYLEGEFLFSPRSGVLRGVRLSRQAASNSRITLRVLEPSGVTVKEGESRIAMITFRGKTQEQASSLLEFHRSTRDDPAQRLVEVEIEP